MGAICGALLHGGKGAPDGMAAMRAALPTTEGNPVQWTEGQVHLGGRRAAASTEEAYGGPPLCFDRDASLVLTADARIDDRDGLCEALGIPHSERTAASDGDLILAAYARWGRECPNHLLGDYAFAVWDTRKRTLFCARDHIGARPFYYALSPHGFIFASTVEAVLAAPAVSDELDENVVATYLSRLFLNSTTRTFYKMVRRLPPGHALTVAAVPDAHSPARLERYWRPERTPKARPGGDDEYAAEFLDLYSCAVKDRLRGGPVGVHLSGGLDSSSTAVLTARELRRRGLPPPPAFSWLPPLGAAPPKATHAPEYALIDTVCTREGLRVHHCQTLCPDDWLAWFRQDGTYLHNSPLETAVQHRATQLGVRVLLTGLGGDEGVSFCGTGYYAHLLLCGRWGKLAAACRAREGNRIRFLAAIVLHLMHPRLPGNLAEYQRSGIPGGWLISPTFARRARPLPQRTCRDTSVRRVQLRFLQDGGLSHRLDAYAADGFRQGTEYRHPLLDRRLLEFALSLPPEQFRRGRVNRWLMRYALRSVLPAEICWRQNKSDPARSEPMMASFVRAAPVLRREIATASPLTRARYVDVPRLLDRLEKSRFRKRSLSARIFRALTLLDF